MKKNSSVFWMIIILVMVSAVIFYFVLQPTRYNWSERLQLEGDQPYDLGAFYEMLKENGSDTKVHELERTLAAEFSDLSEVEKYSYLSISSSFYPDTQELRIFENFLKEGNTMFVATRHTSPQLPVALHFGTDSVAKFITVLNNEDIYQHTPDSIISQYDKLPNYSQRDSLHEYFKSALREKFYRARTIDTAVADSNATIKFTQGNKHLELQYDVSNQKILHLWKGIFPPQYAQYQTIIKYKDGTPAAINWKVGKGNLIICSTPIIFTNYFVKDESKFDFANGLLAPLSNSTILLENVSRYRNYGGNSGPQSEVGDSPLSFILGQNALRWAWYTLILAVLLFVLFKAKRKQRVIPILKPNINTTLAYAKMLGSLQLRDKNNSAKGEEIYGHFAQSLRNKNRWHGQMSQDELKSQLVKLMPDLRSEIEIMLHLGAKAKSHKPMSDQEIVTLFNYTKLIVERI